MSWRDLTIVAAETPPTAGLRLSLPVLRAGDGACFFVRNVSVDDPERQAVLCDLDSAVDTGAVVRVTERPAAQDCVIIVARRSFLEALRDLGPLDIEFSDDPSDICSAYGRSTDLEQWCDELAKRLLDYSSARFSAATRLSELVSDATKIESRLRMIRYLSRVGDQRRMQMIAQLGVLLRLIAPDRWAALETLAQREANLTKSELRARIDREEATLRIDRFKRSLPEIFGTALRRTSLPVAELRAA